MAAQPSGRSRINWEALKAEFLVGEETLNQFRLRHGLNKNHFYDKAQTWPEDRGRIREKALKKVEKELETYYAGFVVETKDLLTSVNAHLKKLIKGSLKDGEVVAAIPVDELKKMSESISVNLKTVRLMSDKSTENLSTKNYHLAITQMLADREKGQAPE